MGFEGGTALLLPQKLGDSSTAVVLHPWIAVDHGAEDPGPGKWWGRDQYQAATGRKTGWAKQSTTRAERESPATRPGGLRHST